MPRKREAGIQELAHSIEFELREINQAMRRTLDAEYARGQLTAAQRIVMQVLFHSEGMSLKELCNRVALSHSTVSGIVDRLQAKGLIARSTDSTDRRVSHIAVTPVVRQFMQQQAPRLAAAPLIAALSRLSEQERRAVSRGLRLLRAALDKGDA